MSRYRLAAAFGAAAVVVGLGVIAALLSVDRGDRVGQERPSAGCVDTWFGQCLAEDLGKMAEGDPQAALAEYEKQAEANGRVREVCHQLFHSIGTGATKSSKEPWEVFMIGSSACNWGYVHGAVEGYLKGDIASVIARADRLCSVPPGIAGDREYINSVAGNCVHGTGHALFHANEDPVEAARGCREAFREAQMSLNCIDGIIMEFGGSKAAKSGEHSNICQEIGEDAKETCYKNVALTWYYQSGGEYLKVFNQCSEAGTEELIYTCTWGAGNLFTVQRGFDLQYLQGLCAELEGSYARGCYAGAAVAGALGVNTGVLDRAELDGFIGGIEDPEWQQVVNQEIAEAESGFGQAVGK